MTTTTRPPLSKQEQALFDIYMQAQKDLRRVIDSGQGTDRDRYLIRQVYLQLTKLTVGVDQWAKMDLPNLYYEGVLRSEKILAGMGVAFAPHTDRVFAQIHKSALSVLAGNTVATANRVAYYMGRHIEDEARRIGLELTAQGIAQGQSYGEVAQHLSDQFEAYGVPAITTSNGRKIPIEAYSRMVARTTTREATNAGMATQLSTNGLDLVMFIGHANPCELCGPLQGRVFSISGKDGRFLPLNVAFPGGHWVRHPNCRDVLTPYVESLKDPADVEVKSRESLRPIEDDRTQQQINAYNRRQDKVRRENAARKEYQETKALLGSEAPSTLEKYLELKAASGDNYSELRKKTLAARRALP